MNVALEITALHKRYSSFVALDDVNMAIDDGEMIAILGPSGCGKTTTLRAIAGFIQPTSGDILLNGRSILGVPTYKRNLGLVFQSYALFPHYTVEQNIAFGLKMQKYPTAETSVRVAEMLRLVKLEQFAGRYPRELSGGQQQRVALARALATRPKLLLMDEPLSNLDAALRQEVSRDIRLLQREAGLTSILVTHDQQEAMSMADRLVVMNKGHVQQIATPQDLYERPANTFVASFIGASTLLSGELRQEKFYLAGNDQVIHLQRLYRGVGMATLALRPERIRLRAPQQVSPNTLFGRVELATYMGSMIEYVVSIGNTERIIVRNNIGNGGANQLWKDRDAVALEWGSDAEHLFDKNGNAYIADESSKKMSIGG